jgi:hypothetical protein
VITESLKYPKLVGEETEFPKWAETRGHYHLLKQYVPFYAYSSSGSLHFVQELIKGHSLCLESTHKFPNPNDHNTIVRASDHPQKSLPDVFDRAKSHTPMSIGNR